jgi:hypothetical protein
MSAKLLCPFRQEDCAVPALGRGRWPMIYPDDREAGFYWISINGQEAEVAQWQSEWETWLVTGRAQPLTDEVGIKVEVLSACLTPPARWSVSIRNDDF